jgi:hypothetical protein
MEIRMTHNQALTALADAIEKLDRSRMESPLHISAPGGDGYMLMTRALYAKMVKRIYDLQQKSADSSPTDEEIRLILARDPRKGMH